MTESDHFSVDVVVNDMVHCLLLDCSKGNYFYYIYINLELRKHGKEKRSSYCINVVSIILIHQNG